MSAGKILAALVLASAISAPAFAQNAQQPSPPLGSPAATITIPGDQLPPPPQKFGGKIVSDAKNSKPFWPARVVPPKGAPNVLLIITDDAGYGVSSTLQALFLKEAEKYQVLPLDSTVVTRIIAPRPSLSAGRTSFTWTHPMTGTPNGDAPSLLNASYSFKVDIEIPQGGAEGMLITQGGRYGGYGFYLLKSKPVFTWNLVDLKRIRCEGPELAPGKHQLEFDFKYAGLGPATMAFGNFSGVGAGGTGTLKVDGNTVATEKMEHSIPFILQWDESLDIGSDTGTSVNDDDYSTPFVFTGKLNTITLNIDRPKLSPEDIKRLEEAARAAGDGPSADAGKTSQEAAAPEVSSKCWPQSPAEGRASHGQA
jgi:hypothetical protein